MTTPRFYAVHDFTPGTRCRVRPENCGSFSILRYSARDMACVFCGRCLACAYDVERCTSEKSRNASPSAPTAEPPASGTQGEGAVPGTRGQLELGAPSPAPSRRRVRRRAA